MIVPNLQNWACVILKVCNSFLRKIHKTGHGAKPSPVPSKQDFLYTLHTTSTTPK